MLPIDDAKLFECFACQKQFVNYALAPGHRPRCPQCDSSDSLPSDLAQELRKQGLASLPIAEIVHWLDKTSADRAGETDQATPPVDPAQTAARIVNEVKQNGMFLRSYDNLYEHDQGFANPGGMGLLPATERIRFTPKKRDTKVDGWMVGLIVGLVLVVLGFLALVISLVVRAS